MESITPGISEAVKNFRSGNYKDTKADLFRAIKDMNVSRDQLKTMMGMLNHPAAGMLNKISPGLVDNLKNLGAELGDGATSSNSPNDGGGFATFLPLRKKD